MQKYIIYAVIALVVAGFSLKVGWIAHRLHTVEPPVIDVNSMEAVIKAMVERVK